MLVYQNGVKIFEAYEQSNVCGMCGLGLWRFVYNLFFRPTSGGSPTQEFRMYSMTKSLAGLAALILVKQERLNLEDRVSMYIPEWSNDPDKFSISV